MECGGSWVGILSGAIGETQSVVHYRSLHAAAVMGGQVLGIWSHYCCKLPVLCNETQLLLQVTSAPQWNTRGSDTNVTQCNETPLRIPGSISQPTAVSWVASFWGSPAICTLHCLRACDAMKHKREHSPLMIGGIGWELLGDSLMWTSERCIQLCDCES